MKKDTVIGIAAVAIVAGYSVLGFYVQKWSSQNINSNNKEVVNKEVVVSEESEVTVSEKVSETTAVSTVSELIVSTQASTVFSDVSGTTVSADTSVSQSDSVTAASESEITSGEVTTVTPETANTESVTEAPKNDEQHEEQHEQPIPEPQPDPEPEPQPEPEQEQANDPEPPASASEIQRELFRLVNERRTQVGVSPLQCTEQFNLAADRRAQEIPDKFEHVRPDDREWYTIFSDFGIPAGYMGENIAAGSSTPAGVFEQWCNSPDHYANIINGNFKYIGIGYVNKPGTEYQYYWVQLFG